MIEKMGGIIFLPCDLTENSKHKAVRVLGVLANLVWFLPASVIWVVLGGFLSVFALIQDA